MASKQQNVEFSSHIFQFTRLHGVAVIQGLTFRDSVVTLFKSTRWYVLTGDPLHSRAACTQPCNVNKHIRAHCSPGARLCEQWGHGCVKNGARLFASARLCRGSPVVLSGTGFLVAHQLYIGNVMRKYKIGKSSPHQPCENTCHSNVLELSLL